MPETDRSTAITALARETARELFDEDIVRPDLEFDEASFNLFAGIIADALRQIQQQTIDDIGNAIDSLAADCWCGNLNPEDVLAAIRASKGETL